MHPLGFPSWETNISNSATQPDASVSHGEDYLGWKYCPNWILFWRRYDKCSVKAEQGSSALNCSKKQFWYLCLSCLQNLCSNWRISVSYGRVSFQIFEMWLELWCEIVIEKIVYFKKNPRVCVYIKPILYL